MAPKGTPTQDFVPVKEVRDGIMVLKDGSLAAVIMVSSINLSLKNYDEQRATLMQFQNFLNTIDFPIQILIQSRLYDVRPYIITLQDRLRAQTEPLLQVQTREYIQFIQTFTEQVNIMRKTFFVIVPYVPPLISQDKGFFKFISNLSSGSKEIDPLSSFEEYRNQIEQRVSVVDQGLSRLGLRIAQLGTQEVIELLYKTFNPGDNTSSSI